MDSAASHTNTHRLDRTVMRDPNARTTLLTLAIEWWRARNARFIDTLADEHFMWSEVRHARRLHPCDICSYSKLCWNKKIGGGSISASKFLNVFCLLALPSEPGLQQPASAEPLPLSCRGARGVRVTRRAASVPRGIGVNEIEASVVSDFRRYWSSQFNSLSKNSQWSRNCFPGALVPSPGWDDGGDDDRLVWRGDLYVGVRTGLLWTKANGITELTPNASQLPLRSGATVAVMIPPCQSATFWSGTRSVV